MTQNEVITLKFMQRNPYYANLKRHLLFIFGQDLKSRIVNVKLSICQRSGGGGCGDDGGGDRCEETTTCARACARTERGGHCTETIGGRQLVSGA